MALPNKTILSLTSNVSWTNPTWGTPSLPEASALHLIPSQTGASETCKTNPGDLARWERRDCCDRRRYSWRTVTYCGFQGRGRRKAVRREKNNYYLDCLDNKLVYTGLVLLVLSCLDAFFTLTLIDYGAYETNRFMALLLELGTFIFLFSKITITSICVMALVMHGNFYIRGLVKAEHALQGLLSIYCLLMVWEMFMLVKIT